MNSVDTKILERELTKAQLENKALRQQIATRVSYEADMCRKLISFCEMTGIPFKEVMEYFARRDI